MAEKHRFLVCPPDYFDIEYAINPWMTSGVLVDPAQARQEWHHFIKALIEAGAEVVTVDPQPKLVDMVFAANCGFAYGKQFFPARYRHPERRPEEAHFQAWFHRNGYSLAMRPEGLHFEGCGDIVPALNEEGSFAGWFFGGHGFRSDPESHAWVAETLELTYVPIQLVDERFYHLDTCLACLPGERVIWYPPAMDEASQQRVRGRIPPEKRYEVSDADAASFACNGVTVGRSYVLPGGSDELLNWLRSQNIQPVLSPMDEFRKSGGANYCTVLRLI